MSNYTFSCKLLRAGSPKWEEYTKDDLTQEDADNILAAPPTAYHLLFANLPGDPVAMVIEPSLVVNP